MAHLVRPWIVRYLDKNDKRVPKGTRGARKVRERARKWYGQGLPYRNPKQRFPLASDKEAAKQMLADMVKRAGRGEFALAGPEVDQGKRPLDEHVTDFGAALRARDVSDKQVQLVLKRVRDVIKGCGFAHPRDIALDPVQAYLASRRALPKKKGGLSIQTSNFYLGAMQQFCRWLTRTKPRRLVENPMADAERGNVELDRRHDRRELTPQELLLTLQKTQASENVFRDLAGVDRYHLYLTACGTGFRSGELAVLTPAEFALGADPPTVTLAARFTKNKRPVVQPLPSGVAAALRVYLVGKPADSPVWPGTWLEKASRMFKADLEAADVPYVVQGPNGPLYADFHALRHTFVSLLARSGMGMKAAKELARHSDVNLTMARYAHAALAELGEAVEHLALPGPKNRAAVQEHVDLSAVKRQDLEAAVVVLWELARALFGLVAPQVAPNIGMQAEHAETPGDKRERKPAERARKKSR